MANFVLLHKKENDAIVILPYRDIEVADYMASGYEAEYEGTKTQCLQWADEFWIERDIPEDQRILLNKRA